MWKDGDSKHVSTATLADQTLDVWCRFRQMAEGDAVRLSKGEQVEAVASCTPFGPY